MDGLDGTPYPWLTRQVIAQIEKQLNPAGLAFHPPKSWSCPELDMALKSAYRSKFPDAKCEPDYERLTKCAEKELDRILEGRREQYSMANSIETWKKEKFPGSEPFNSVALIETMNVGPSPSAPTRKNQNSPESTLPLQSQRTQSSSITSVSTGLGTITLTGNSGEPSSHKSENSGPSPRRPTPHSPRPRRGRGGSNQPRPGAHVCSFNGCGKKFQYPSKLKDHEHTHRDKKDYACTLGSCGKSFKRRRELKAHLRTHGHPSQASEMEPDNEDQVMTDAGQIERESPGRRNMEVETGLGHEGVGFEEGSEHTMERRDTDGGIAESEIDLGETPYPENQHSKTVVNRVASASPPTPADRGAPSPPTSPPHKPDRPDPSLPIMHDPEPTTPDPVDDKRLSPMNYTEIGEDEVKEKIDNLAIATLNMP